MPASLAPPDSASPFAPETPPLDGLLAALLRCPACAARPPLTFRATPEAALVCADCGRSYPVADGIPYLFVDDTDSDPANTESRARF